MDRVQTWDCAVCGKRSRRNINSRSNTPKYCSAPCKELGRRPIRTCLHCGVEYRGHGVKFCSTKCAYAQRSIEMERRIAADPSRKRRSDRKPKESFKSPLRRANDADDWDGIIAVIKSVATVDLDGCWLWPAVDSSGYARQTIAKQFTPIYRLSLEASLRARIINQPVHHICAKRACVNPEHLQAVTDFENKAEMMSRRAYLRRISELEDALAEVAPKHRLLSVLPLW